MKLIVNADDFGMSDDTVDATIACFEQGGLSSATIMPNMPATQRAMEYACSHPQYSFGVHLTFSSDGQEYPLSEPAKIPDLLQHNGQFLGPVAVRSRAMLGKLPVAQIIHEMRCQIAFLLDQGVPVSHVDSHGHLHKFKPFRQALKAVLPEFGIDRVRAVQDIYLHKPLKSPTYWLGHFWKRRIRRSFKTTDYFFMPSHADRESWPDALSAHMHRLPSDRMIEIGVHPGVQESWRNDERLACIRFIESLDRDAYPLTGWTAVR